MTEPLFTRRFLGLWIFGFVTFFSAFQLLPVIPLRIVELGGSKAVAGWFLSAYTFASAFSAPVMGAIADHVGRKRLMIIASALFIIFSILYGVITFIPLLLVVGVIHGALWSGLLSSASAIMSVFIPVSRRNEGLAYWGLAGNMAIAAAPAIGMFVFTTGGWFMVCLEMAALSAVMLMWSARLHIEETRPETALPSLRDAWDWSVARAALSLGVVAVGYGGITSYVAIFSMERNIHPESLFFTICAIAVVLVRVTTSKLGDRFGPKPILYPSFAAVPISFAVLAVADSRWELVLSAALFGLAMGSVWPAFTNFILAHTDERRRARTFGSIVWAFDTGIGVGSLAIGAIGQRWSLGTAFGVAAGLSCLSIPIFLAASRQMTLPEA
jgi:MFS family permease